MTHDRRLGLPSLPILTTRGRFGEVKNHDIMGLSFFKVSKYTSEAYPIVKLRGLRNVNKIHCRMASYGRDGFVGRYNQLEPGKLLSA